MKLVIKIINCILANALNHRQFQDFLDEIGSEYQDLLLHNNVRWLSRGKVLNRFVALLDEIKTFLKKKDHKELDQDQWLQKLFFKADLTYHLNELNRKLQGRGRSAFSLLEDVASFSIR